MDQEGHPSVSVLPLVAVVTTEGRELGVPWSLPVTQACRGLQLSGCRARPPIGVPVLIRSHRAGSTLPSFAPVLEGAALSKADPPCLSAERGAEPWSLI